MKYCITGIMGICASEKSDVLRLKVKLNGSGAEESRAFFACAYADDGEFRPSSPANHLSLSSAGGVLHNAYESGVPFYKSHIYGITKTDRTGLTYDFKNVFWRQRGNRIEQAVQTGGVIYALTPPSEYGHAVLDCDSYQYLSSDNGAVTLPDRQVQTPLFNRTVVNQLVRGERTLQDLAKDEEISKTILGVRYQAICEMPGAVQNDCDSGNLAIGTYTTKNNYDSLYDMPHDELKLQNARTYVGIGCCNKQVYLKYFDNVNYDTDTAAAEKPGVVQVSADIDDSNCAYGRLQHIEVVDQIGRFVQSSARAATLYGLTLNTDIVSKVKADFKDKIRDELKRCVKSIAQKLAPVQTQLFGVTVADAV